MMGSLSYRRNVVKIVFQALAVLIWLGTCLAEDLAANFVFGDSLVEVGNNNYILSICRADHKPHGIDFGKPTGRFSNNRTIIDIMGQELGLKEFTPPYLAPTTVGAVLLKGVNYASGGGGILNETGMHFIGRINLDAQLDNFANTRQDIISMIGEPAALELLNKALYSVTIGSNDILNNYLLPIYSTAEQKKVSPEAFVESLIPRFRIQLTRLYDMGARKIVVINLGPLGCIPNQRDFDPSEVDGCSAKANYLAKLFNSKAKALLPELSTLLKGSIFVYANVDRIFSDIIQNYTSYGFQNSDSACCRLLGKHGGVIPCGPVPVEVCPDRSKHVFWDWYHPSDASNVIIAKRLLDGDSQDISPMNIRALVYS